MPTPSQPLPGDAAPPASVSGHPAGYGRSCTTCSRAKSKCVFRSSKGGPCERCRRLGKNCEQMVTSRKRMAKRPAASSSGSGSGSGSASSSRTALLEEKLHDLIEILRSSQQPAGVAAATAAAALADATSAAMARADSGGVVPPSMPHLQGSPTPQRLSRLDSLADAAVTGQSHASHARAHAYPSPGASSTLCENDRLPEPTPSEAEAYLDRFRTWLDHWPFMRLDGDVTADELRRERPLLWLSIMNLTTASVPQQHLLRERLRSEVSRRLISECERNMDMLLAVLAHVGWAASNSCISGKAFIVMFIQIAIGLAEEMGLTKFPNEVHYSTICFMTWCDQLQVSTKARTLEERRAVLSLWCLSSIYSAFIGKTEAVPYTPYMQECLEVLEREKDYPNDETLVALIKLQLVGDEAHKHLSRDRLNHEMRKDGSLVPMHVFKRGLLGQLNSLRQTMDPSVAAKYVVYSHSMSIEAQIHMIGIFGEQKLSDAPRVEAVYAALLAIRNWYESFFELALDSVAGMPLGNYVCMAQMQQLLYDLTVAEDPTWDREQIRSTADLLAYVDRCIAIFTRAYAVHGFRHDGKDVGFLARFARTLRDLRSLWDSAFSRPPLDGMPTPDSEVMMGGGGGGGRGGEGRDGRSASSTRSNTAATPSTLPPRQGRRQLIPDRRRNRHQRSLRPVTVPQAHSPPRTADMNGFT